MFKRLLLCAGILMPLLSSAQYAGQIGFYEHIPQRVLANPSLQPTGKLNIGFPALSQMYVEQSNNWLNTEALLEINGEGTARINEQQLLSQIDEELFTGFGLHLELLHVGLKLGRRNYLHFRVAERIQSAFALPRDLIALGVHGNVGPNGFDNNTADFGNLRLDAMHFREYAVGYSRSFQDNWGVGLTAKFLYGMESVQTKESSLRLRTDPLTYALQSSGSLRVNTSGLNLGEEDQDIREDVGDYLFGLPNRGLGVDFGGWYKPIEKLTLEFSALDLGFISWRADVANFGTDDASFGFDGVDLSEFVLTTGNEFSDGFDDALQGILDEAEEAYGLEETYNSYRSTLFAMLRYAASYELYSTAKTNGTAWASAVHGVGHGNIPTRISAGYQQQIWRVFQIGAHYSHQVGSGGFVGGGLAVNGGPVQLHIMVENMRIARWSKYTLIDDNGAQSTTLFIPANANDLRMHFGINFTFGRNKVKEVVNNEPMLR